MELLAAMALDRDAINTVTLRLLPPSATPGAVASPWLLWHTIPITASLSRTLSRLVSIEASAMAQAPLEITSSLTVALSPPLSPAMAGSIAASATATTPQLLIKSALAVPQSDTADPVALCHSARRSPDRNVRSSSVASTSSSSLASTSSALLARTRLMCSTVEAEQMSWIELVRVGYVVSEIHAYCILLKCHRAAQAALIKTALEEGAALGLTAPVEYVSDAQPVIVTHCAFAEPRGEPEAEEVGAGDPRISDHELDGDHHQTHAGARWCTGTHKASLWEAIATVYPIRGNGDSAGGEGHGDDASDGDDDEHTDTCGSLQRHNQYHHPHHLHRSPHTASSGPATPSQARRSPALTPAVRKGAAPPPPRHTSAFTAAVAPSTCNHAPLSPAAAVGRAALSCAAHTPPHLPLAGGGGGGGGGLGPLLSSDFCPICLDPLYLSTCVTTLCQHAFHLSCYAQLPSGSAECPLCRFSVYDLLNDARCKVCGTYEDLWVCLICGHVACGRARRDHQQEHYRSSGHSCSWQSTTNRIRNSSSRMFLHQEVALLLEEDDVEDMSMAENVYSRGAATRLHSADAGASEAGTSSENTSTAKTAITGAVPPSGRNHVLYMSWSDSLMDHDLHEALNESKEEAVAQYYTQFLHQLAEEQQRWYEAKLAERRRRRSERQVVAAGASAGGCRTESTLSHTTLRHIAMDERQQRRRVLSEYVQTTISLLHDAQREYAGMTRKLKAARNEVQQQVLLCSHLNSGLSEQVEQVRQRTQELQRKGEKTSQQKAAEEANLQRLVHETLSSL
ncbi:Ring finger domain/Zn-finger in ubiquitin-hydrolase-like protein, putative [Leishmania guyanensis]|uniref:RING-type domain-containing protein n=1 Tax=Leishmania guyanensis TaxID=5670 RepID=A0A1E1IN16_LEIGU|nr:hypothetical protein, conserved [Leishmania guyanensis]